MSHRIVAHYNTPSWGGIFWVPTGIRTRAESSTNSSANRYTIGTMRPQRGCRNFGINQSNCPRPRPTTTDGVESYRFGTCFATRALPFSMSLRSLKIGRVSHRHTPHLQFPSRERSSSLVLGTKKDPMGLFSRVPRTGIEPARDCSHMHLKHTRIPGPPPGHSELPP